ncbi:hypothetical protein SYNPS1DRAFT_30519 [Syncephalis pseudoplumigaleata]|uniref:Uncharacterized protein n=1 Tax=Syncephalis pseudoplumigaleata TaxID=1712513 RepID=A0A4P9YVA4_9FUNG|nr:hypothetical protein SYNPS1DRAFT_30519 [Syncephalis pseudoplumigaleata]|eukprot:RKP23725.1 hypothetical protein SYNPS1DRAFT_30519 [Syncephalis pseudoplumigaleata]
MLPSKRRREKHKRRKLEQREGVSIQTPGPIARPGRAQPPALPRIMFRYRAQASAHETPATTLITGAWRMLAIILMSMPEVNKVRDDAAEGLLPSKKEEASDTEAVHDVTVPSNDEQPTEASPNDATPAEPSEEEEEEEEGEEEESDNDDVNTRPITTREFDDRAYAIPRAYRWPKLRLKEYTVGEPIPKGAATKHLLPWQLQYRHSVPTNTAFAMMPEVTSERVEQSTTNQAGASSTMPLQRTDCWHHHAIADRQIYEQMASQFEDVIYEVWRHLVTPNGERNNDTDDTATGTADLPHELPGPLVDAAVVDMMETFRRLLLCMIQLKER